MRTSKTTRKAVALGTVALLVTLAAAAGTDDGSGVVSPRGHIETLRMGDHWYGPKVTPKDLIGKVVLLEYWGS